MKLCGLWVKKIWFDQIKLFTGHIFIALLQSHPGKVNRFQWFRVRPHNAVVLQFLSAACQVSIYVMLMLRLVFFFF